MSACYRRLFMFGFVVGVVLSLAIRVHGQSFASGGSLFSDIKAHRPGDILTIHIVEASQGSNQSNSSTEKKTTSGMDTNGSGLFKFLPLAGFEAKNTLDFTGRGNTNRSGQLRARMTARIKSVDRNGNFVIEGTREVEINSEKMLMTLSGVVRPDDIAYNNVILSYQIADAKISYKGKGHSASSSKPGLLTRLFNWLF